MSEFSGEGKQMRSFTKKRMWVVFFLVLCGMAVFYGITPARGEAGQTCTWDFAPWDRDVDGRDLVEFIQGMNAGDLPAFAEEYGSICFMDCRHYLPCQVVEANQCFADAIATDSDPILKVFYSVTRMLALAYNPEINTLLTELGVAEEVRELCHWTADWPLDEQGDVILLPELPATGQALDVLISAVLPQIDGALDDLSGIDETIAEPFIVLCGELVGPDDSSPCENIEVDYGDVALYRAMLQGMKAFLTIVDAYDWNIENTAEFIEKIRNDIFVINEYLCEDTSEGATCLPDFLRMDADAPALLAQARQSLDDAIDSYMEASAYIRAETDNQENDLILFPQDPEDIADEESFRANLLELQCALFGPCSMDTFYPENPFLLDLTSFFDARIHLRDYLPDFTDDNEMICGSFDPEFGGILPGFDIDRWAHALEIRVPVTGEVSVAESYTGGNIVVEALFCGWEPADISEYRWCSKAGSVSLSSPGTYEMPLQTHETDTVYMLGYWDKDSDGILSPGDLYGFYPGNPFTVTSVYCNGPADIDMHLGREVTGIKGRVTSDGGPVKGVWVYAQDYNTGNWGGASQTDSEGNYSISGLETGTYRVMVNTYGTDYLFEYYDNVREYSSATPVNVVAGLPATGIDFSLEIGGKITGRVTRASDGTPVEDVDVNAYDAETGGYVSGAWTAPDGTYTLSGLPEGSYKIWAYSYYDDNLLAEYYNGVQDWASATVVSVVKEQPTPDIDFSLVSAPSP
jgi:hypothetical protein